ETGGSLRVAVFLPRPGPGAALERTGSVAAAPLLARLAPRALGWLLARPRSAVRDLPARATRSYPKRPGILFAAMLLLPVGAGGARFGAARAGRVRADPAARLRSWHGDR